MRSSATRHATLDRRTQTAFPAVTFARTSPLPPPPLDTPYTHTHTHTHIHTTLSLPRCTLCPRIAPFLILAALFSWMVIVSFFLSLPFRTHSSLPLSLSVFVCFIRSLARTSREITARRTWNHAASHGQSVASFLSLSVVSHPLRSTRTVDKLSIWSRVSLLRVTLRGLPRRSSKVPYVPFFVRLLVVVSVGTATPPYSAEMMLVSLALLEL